MGDGMKDPGVKPVFRDLDPTECVAILERNRLGRLAFSRATEVDVQPVHYVARGNWIFGRTSAGEKLSALERNWRVAFQVDEVTGTFDWSSVVVRGGFYVLSPDGNPTEAARWQQAVDALRTFMPETLTDNDPVPFRNVLFGIAVQEMTGRRAETERPRTD